MESYSDADLVDVLNEQIAEIGGLRKWAKAHDFTPSFLSDVRAGRRNITDRLATALGFERNSGWVKKETSK